MYIILNLLYTRSNRHVVALGGHHFDNGSKRLMSTSKPCASTTKSSNINVTLVVDDMFQLPLQWFPMCGLQKILLLYGQQEIMPTRQGIALRLNEWLEMRKTIEAINDAHPTLGSLLHIHVLCRTIITTSCRHWNVDDIPMPTAGLLCRVLSIHPRKRQTVTELPENIVFQ